MKITAIKIKTETALGIIFLLAVIVVIAIYFLSREDFAIANKILKKTKTAISKSKNEDLRLLFASNGQRNIYKVQKGDKWAVEIDGQESQAFDFVDNPTFSPDGTQFVYSATDSGQSFMVIDNTVQEQVYDKILQIIFSPDGKKLGYVAEKGSQSMIVLNGQEGKAYQEIAPLQTSSGSTYIIFSPDGKSIAYKVVDDKGTYVVVNGQAGKVYTDIISFAFTPDGQFTYQAQSGDQQITIVNNQEVTRATAGNTSGNSNYSEQNSNTQSGSSGRSSRNKKDVHLDQNRLFYPACTGSAADKSCNF